MRLEVDPKHATAPPFIFVWAVLLILASVSMASAFLRLGVWAPIVEFGIAAIQAAMVFVVFMRLKGPPSLKWVFAGTGFFWLLFLYGLSMTDYATRQGWPAHTIRGPVPVEQQAPQK